METTNPNSVDPTLDVVERYGLKDNMTKEELIPIITKVLEEKDSEIKKNEAVRETWKGNYIKELAKKANITTNLRDTDSIVGILTEWESLKSNADASTEELRKKLGKAENETKQLKDAVELAKREATTYASVAKDLQVKDRMREIAYSRGIEFDSKSAKMKEDLLDTAARRFKVTINDDGDLDFKGAQSIAQLFDGILQLYPAMGMSSKELASIGAANSKTVPAGVNQSGKSIEDVIAEGIKKLGLK